MISQRSNRAIRISRLLAAVLMMCAPAWPVPGTKPAAALPEPDFDLARRLESAFVRVAERASESVVVITATRTIGPQSDAQTEEELREQFEGTPFEFFFRQLPRPLPRDIDNQGSGVILRRDGYIVTNKHVVERADKIRVRFKDGREMPATLVGVDPHPQSDIAVIKVDATDLPVGSFGDSDQVRVGQWAIAIGAPFELDYSFTVGFVSAVGRSAVTSRGGSAYENYIQTDAAINPGNSGGPLCDIEGRVIGINTLIRGLNRGIGFAIPINTALQIADQIINTGKVTRPWIGIGIAPLSENTELAEMLKDSGITEGVVVQEIHPDTPAAASELKPADVIIAVDDTPVKSPRDLQQQILRKRVGDTVHLDVVRGHQRLKLQIKTDEMPDPLQFAARTRPGRSRTETTFGLTVQTLSRQLAQQLGLNDQTGVVVTAVADGSIAQQKGLQHGDIITELNRTPVRTAEEFQTALAQADPKKGVLLYYKRGDTASFVVLKEAQ